LLQVSKYTPVSITKAINYKWWTVFRSWRFHKIQEYSGGFAIFSVDSSCYFFLSQQSLSVLHSPTTAHWEAVKHILRYLKGTMGLDCGLVSPKPCW
jgi:hypothetical protein